jgi:hypothetical protein
MKAFVARGVTLGLERSVESHNTLGSQTRIMPVVHNSIFQSKVRKCFLADRRQRL